MNKYTLLNKNELLDSFKTSYDGLETKEVEKRKNKYGYNELPKEEHKSTFKVFLSTFNDPIIYVLLVTVLLSFLAKEFLDAVAIIFIILIDSVVSTIQEKSAEKNTESLKNLIKVFVKVIRNGKYNEIDSCELVPGDLVIIEPGTKVSADIRLLSASNLTVDESILTGESVGVLKNDSNSKNNAKNNSNLLFAGTSVLTGRGKGIVVSTGIDTELGKIAHKVTSTEESKSPLTVRMEKFSKQISLIVVVISIIIGIVLVLKGYKVMEIFLAVVALGVSAMPEGLPMALTMALTIAANRMAKKNVIVKKLNSVESLGSCTVIASDKTGTLTVNEQTAKKILLCDGEEFNIEGNGYDIEGKVIPVKTSKNRNASYISKLGVINNESVYTKEKNEWKHFGDSIDVAFRVLGYKTGIKENSIRIVNSIPYESEKKFSAVFYEEKNEIRCTAKGSVEEILKFCKYEYHDGKQLKINKDSILNQNELLASQGYRVIAICDGTAKGNKYEEDNIKDLVFVGLVGFIDPVRKEALSSIRKCKSAGIKVIMITGDHSLTAFAIAKELGMVDNYNEVVVGDNLEQYRNNQALYDQYIKDKKVFARISPLEKLRIVESLQRQGEFVAVTGDGVNDAPALKVANIGVAMGSGTDVAKETANMIIVDDNFKSIVCGIEEGRNAYSNIRKICIMLLSCGFAEVLFFVLSIVFGLPLALVAIQLLWLNLVTDGLQVMALSFERETNTIMHEKPRSTKESVFEKELVIQTVLSGLSIGIIVFVVWVFLIKVFHISTEAARGYVLALMVFMQNIHVLNCRSETKSIFTNGFSKNKFVLLTIVGSILLQIVVMEVPVLSRLLQTTSISYSHLFILLIISTTIVFSTELYKYLKFAKNER